LLARSHLAALSRRHRAIPASDTLLLDLEETANSWASAE
jgi:hypothetical protein